jgi:dihydroorotase
LQNLTIRQPDDWHVHLRDGALLQSTVPGTAKHFARALIMPNLKPALTSIAALITYRERILSNLLPGQKFEPQMTFYLNNQVTPEELQLCKNYSFILGAKFYPAGATTNSEQGASSLLKLYPLLEVMQDQNLVLQIHGEVTHGDIFERETDFILNHLQPVVDNFPKLRIVLEHISTQTAIDFVSSAPNTVAATITPHHLLYNRNQLLAGGIRPHYYCLPILKKEKDQLALQKAATSGNPKFFAGTDSAPHSQSTKESACGCAGIYSAPYALALYTQLFDQLNKLDKLESFLSQFGADFYQLHYNHSQIGLVKKKQSIPEFLSLGNERVVPIGAGTELLWSIDE